MRSKIVMVNLITFQNGRILFLQFSHDLLSISNLTIHTLHFVVMIIALPTNMTNMFCSWVRNSEKLLDIGVIKVPCAVGYQNLRSFTCYFFTLLKQWSNVTTVLSI